MRRFGWFGAFVLLVTASWVLTLSGEALAQKKGGGKGGKSQGQGKGKTEEAAKSGEQKGSSDTQEKEMEQEQKGKGKGKKSEGADADKGKGKGSGEMEEAGKGKKMAYKPKGLSEEDMKHWEGGSPPGWSMGTKKGWEGAGAPPGKMKKGDEAKLEKAKERIRTRVRQHEGKGETERKQLEVSAERSIEGAARSGVPVEHAERAVEKGIEKGMTGDEIEKMTRAMAYGADKNTDYGKLEKFMDKKMADGERGDDLAMSVYREIDEQGVEREKVEENKAPWYKRIFRRD